ncbi:MAG: hypothetical protein U0271_10350 [Polyangiaceae bacterium]
MSQLFVASTRNFVFFFSDRGKTYVEGLRGSRRRRGTRAVARS